jgi:hypothetical protein
VVLNKERGRGDSDTPYLEEASNVGIRMTLLVLFVDVAEALLAERGSCASLALHWPDAMEWDLHMAAYCRCGRTTLYAPPARSLLNVNNGNAEEGRYG